MRVWPDQGHELLSWGGSWPGASESALIFRTAAEPQARATGSEVLAASVPFPLPLGAESGGQERLSGLL